MLHAARRRALITAAVAALACDQGLDPSASGSACPPGFVGVCGEVKIRGAVPESTETVYVVAFDEFPRQTGDLFFFQPPLPFVLPLGDTIAFYRLPLSPGRYEWILAVWKKQGTLTINTAEALLREAGFYRDPADPARPGVVQVSGGLGGIDFTVDFGNMHEVSHWFPPMPAVLP